MCCRRGTWFIQQDNSGVESVNGWKLHTSPTGIWLRRSERAQFERPQLFDCLPVPALSALCLLAPCCETREEDKKFLYTCRSTLELVGFSCRPHTQAGRRLRTPSPAWLPVSWILGRDNRWHLNCLEM